MRHPMLLRPRQAADELGIDRAAFDHHVLPEIDAVRRGRRTLIPREELDRWIDANLRRRA